MESSNPGLLESLRFAGNPDCWEAAYEIERLRAALDEIIEHGLGERREPHHVLTEIRSIAMHARHHHADGPSVAMRTPILDLFVVELRKQLNLNPQHIEGRGHWPQNVELSGDEWAAIIGALAGGPAVEIAECHIRPHDYCSAGTCEVCRDAQRYRFIRTNRPEDWKLMPGDVLDRAIDNELRAAQETSDER